MHLLVGLLTGSSAACRLQAARCLHQLSHSPHSSVSPACLPSTPYLLTYLSGQSTKFTVSTEPFIKICFPFSTHATWYFNFVRVLAQELCLYTLGNLCTYDVVKEKLLAQGIITALASCIEVS